MDLASGFSSVILLSILLDIACAENLTCYKCETTDPFDHCVKNVSLAEQDLCEPNENYCMVFRVDIMGVFTSMHRSCAKICSSRCGVWGDEEDEHRCSSCCETDLCNTDNSAVSMFINLLPVCTVFSFHFISNFLHSN